MIISSSCTNGEVKIRGIVEVDDQSTGTFLADSTRAIKPSDIAQIKKKTSTLPIVIPAS
jgi:hypothetical protein